MYLLYSFVLALAAIISSPWWLWRLFSTEKYRAGLSERLGRVPDRLRTPGEHHPTVWIHAVSVGEALAITGLVARLRASELAPRVVVSTTTQTGQKLARERFGQNDVFYFPVDFGFAIKPYLQMLKPDVVVLAETEFWPNFINLAKASGAQILVANARISDRSFPRYHQWRSLLAGVLKNVDAFLSQSEEDARRLRAIGAEESRVHVSGNLKFDVKPPSAESALVATLNAVKKAHERPVIVAGSTVEGEEPLVLAAFREVQANFASALLILAPRHRERFAAVADLVRNSGISFVSRSTLDLSSPDTTTRLSETNILLLDTLGELASVYSVADIAFVGGSLVPRGGHNILEPAYFGVATLVGPHTENFRDIISLFARENAVVVSSTESLAGNISKLLDNAGERKSVGDRAAQVLRSQRGATERTALAIEQALRDSAGVRSYEGSR